MQPATIIPKNGSFHFTAAGRPNTSNTNTYHTLLPITYRSLVLLILLTILSNIATASLHLRIQYPPTLPAPITDILDGSWGGASIINPCVKQGQLDLLGTAFTINYHLEQQQTILVQVSPDLPIPDPMKHQTSLTPLPIPTPSDSMIPKHPSQINEMAELLPHLTKYYPGCLQLLAGVGLMYESLANSRNWEDNAIITQEVLSELLQYADQAESVCVPGCGYSTSCLCEEGMTCPILSNDNSPAGFIVGNAYRDTTPYSDLISFQIRNLNAFPNDNNNPIPAKFSKTSTTASTYVPSCLGSSVCIGSRSIGTCMTHEAFDEYQLIKIHLDFFTSRSKEAFHSILEPFLSPCVVSYHFVYADPRNSTVVVYGATNREMRNLQSCSHIALKRLARTQSFHIFSITNVPANDYNMAKCAPPGGLSEEDALDVWPGLRPGGDSSHPNIIQNSAVARSGEQKQTYQENLSPTVENNNSINYLEIASTPHLLDDTETTPIDPTRDSLIPGPLHCGIKDQLGTNCTHVKCPIGGKCQTDLDCIYGECLNGRCQFDVSLDSHGTLPTTRIHLVWEGEKPGIWFLNYMVWSPTDTTASPDPEEKNASISFGLLGWFGVLCVVWIGIIQIVS